MLQRIRSRLLQLLTVLFALSLLTFTLMKLAPGDPVLSLLRVDEMQVTMADEAHLREELGLNRPIHQQYLAWLGNVLRLDLGTSILKGKPVLEELLDRLPATIELTLGGLAFMALVAVPLGMLAARYPGRLPDHLGRLFALIGASVPLFWLGLILIFIFSLKLQWLPMTGRGEWKGLILPSVTLGFGLAAVHARLLRSGMLESLSQEYVRSARARGLSEGRLYVKHVLRAALIPVLTVFGMTFGSLLGGSVVVETLFAWPGLGSMAVEAVFQRDYPLVQGYLMMTGLLIITANLAVDLLYGWVDPRIRVKGGRVQ
ncbi:nickel ABC transporter permease [Paenibacillus sp. S-38]|uniref:nickel ABC transporter permease n=1 Tax=Paenibacillus sp. S-38 TaxID=3416710 RepID=UPI003CEBB6B4